VAEVAFDPPAQVHQPHDLLIVQRQLLLALRVERLFRRPAGRQGVDGKPLGGDRLVDDLTAPSRRSLRVRRPHVVPRCEHGFVSLGVKAA
jgi:hypothetical protein